MAETSQRASRQRTPFCPKADAAVLSSARNHGPPPTRPQTVWPIYDPDNLDKPIAPWSPDTQETFYPLNLDEYAPAPIPAKPPECSADQYLRASLAENERLRLSMLWYYTRDIFDESEFLCGLREKLHLAQECTGWEFVVIGLLDVNIYIRLATIGLPLAILPRGETICAHTVTQPPNSVFLLPNMMEDWRFRDCPYVESGGLKAYAGVPLRLQNEFDATVSLGSFCVCSATSQPPLTKSQHITLARLADWIVADIIQCARARRQRERHRMSVLINEAQAAVGDATTEDTVLEMLRSIYSDAVISLQSSKATHIHLEGRDPIPSSDVEDGLWEDVEFLDDFIAHANHKDIPDKQVVRLISAPFQGILGPSLLVVGSKDFRLVFDDIDSWFVQACADILTQIWHKSLLTEALKAKDKFLRGFSHQLRTPVHGILGSAELLAEELNPRGLCESGHEVSGLLEAAPVSNSASSVHLDTIMTAGRDLIYIINNMITLNKWTDVAMSDRLHTIHTLHQFESILAKEILTTINRDARYNASVFLNFNAPTEYEAFETDLSLLQGTLLPLIINAIQNTPGGVVSVTTTLRPDLEELVIDVEDTGSGIHPDDQNRIFEPYEKVEVHSTGAGLGLTLASKFATLLHGSVSLVSSAIGRGSHFRVVFQAMKCIRASVPSKALSTELQNLPSKFCYNQDGLVSTSLCAHFARFLICNGFTPWDKVGDYFTILDHIPDTQQRQAYLSQIPLGQVTIFLVPAMNNGLPFNQTLDNAVYVQAPFLTSTLIAALEEADELIAKLRATGRSESARCDVTSVASSSIDYDWSTNSSDPSVADSTHEEERPAYSPADSAVDLNPPTDSDSSRPGLALRLKKREVPIFATLADTSKPTALLVDDNNVNLRIMQMYCKKRGLPYLCATDGLQAVELFSKHQSLCAKDGGVPIALILMDLQMPICDGISATERIRSLETKMEWRKCIIFMVTGQDSPADRMNAQNAGADDYYVKPVSLKLLDCGVEREFPNFEVPDG